MDRIADWIAHCHAAQQRNSLNCHPFTAPDLAHAFIRLGLHAHGVDGNPEDVSQRGADPIDVRRELRPFRDHHRVHVLDDKTRGANDRKRSPQQVEAVRIPILRIGIGKVAPNVSLGRRTENRIGDRVAQRVTVGMPFQPDR